MIQIFLSNNKNLFTIMCFQVTTPFDRNHLFLYRYMVTSITIVQNMSAQFYTQVNEKRKH